MGVNEFFPVAHHGALLMPELYLPGAKLWEGEQLSQRQSPAPDSECWGHLLPLRALPSLTPTVLQKVILKPPSVLVSVFQILLQAPNSNPVEKWGCAEVSSYFSGSLCFTTKLG